jgi:hypothetical protein
MLEAVCSHRTTSLNATTTRAALESPADGAARPHVQAGWLRPTELLPGATGWISLNMRTQSIRRPIIDSRPRCATGCGRRGTVVPGSRDLCPSCYGLQRLVPHGGLKPGAQPSEVVNQGGPTNGDGQTP